MKEQSNFTSPTSVGRRTCPGSSLDRLRPRTRMWSQAHRTDESSAGTIQKSAFIIVGIKI